MQPHGIKSLMMAFALLSTNCSKTDHDPHQYQGPDNLPPSRYAIVAELVSQPYSWRCSGRTPRLFLGTSHVMVFDSRSRHLFPTLLGCFLRRLSTSTSFTTHLPAPSRRHDSLISKWSTAASTLRVSSLVSVWPVQRVAVDVCS